MRTVAERRDFVPWGCIALLVAVMLGYSLYTGQVWEDFLITFRHSKNLVLGHGLVYQPGEQVQGFTSPLNVLIPALAYRVWPQLDYVGPLWVFRIFGLVVLALGLGFLLRTVGAGDRWRWFCAALLALQVKTVAFAMNGQEAALLVGFLAPALWCALDGHGRHWRLTGICWAGLMWTRPDSPVYLVALALGGLWFSAEPRRAQWRGLAKVAALTTLLYGPWFVWAWTYYGNPVPHTILAKFGAQGLPHTFWAFAGRFAQAWLQALGHAFDPIYAEAGGWPKWVNWLTTLAGSWCALRWLLPGADRFDRLVSWVFFCGALYQAGIGTVGFIFPWYFPPLGLCGAIVLARSMDKLWQRARDRPLARPTTLVITALALAGLAWIMAMAAMLQRVQQQVVENEGRALLGRWLKQHVSSRETVFLEPIGYIGYFSEAHILDYPGLVAPAVVATRRMHGEGFMRAIDVLQPEWLVLRDDELAQLQNYPPLRGRYAPVAALDGGPRLAAYREFPGYGYLFSDISFTVLHRRNFKE